MKNRTGFLVLLVLAGQLLGQGVAKTGFNFGGVPAIAYNSDTGFTYGIIVNTYNYGDGSMYPDYRYSLYTEWSRTTKGSGVNKLFFDSKYLLPKDIRITSELSYLTEQALPFYGLNGAAAPYFSEFEDDTDTLHYISRAFYRHMRNTVKFTADFQRKFLNENLRWIGGFGFISTAVDTVDVATLNEGKDAADQLQVVDGLYAQYVNNGWISSDEATGGLTNYLKLGLVYDTRDNEPNPMSGIWSEALFTLVPEAFGSDFSYTTLTLTHRQYFTLIPENLSFAYRLGYQSVVSGRQPFYMLPYYQGSYKTEEGLGGSKSLRGILKNRIVGKSIAFGNFEFRWKFFRTVVFNQNLYLALNGFMDAGQVLENQPAPENATNIAAYPSGDDVLHKSFGGGLRIALNENFIVAVDMGFAADEADGNSGLYIGLGYLY
ncbi:MAG: BamA/TamA family outer membrane protein [Lentisphaeria bacterium]|nr:BamA/TamA family outer membrane protein [Candidatus Neomarinimicrobiota bacterium]MCF7841526.1 BamA/TamA family outer membrane protein [Lentisphaeria bacterium]